MRTAQNIAREADDLRTTLRGTVRWYGTSAPMTAEEGAKLAGLVADLADLLRASQVEPVEPRPRRLQFPGLVGG